MNNKNRFTWILYALLFLSMGSCKNKNNIKVTESVAAGAKINLMEYAIKPVWKDTAQHFIKQGSQYKIVTYANSYCEPCWNNVLLWKENLKYFKDSPQVSFYCYVHATPQDFELRNADAKLDFPVLLDSRERFKIVNHLGSDPSKLTFLLNSENEVLLIGPPFTKEMREKYLSVISKKNKKHHRKYTKSF